MKKFFKLALGILVAPPRIGRINYLIRYLFWYIAFFIPSIAIYITKIIFGTISGFVETTFIVLVILAMIIGQITAACSRLHDSNRSGWYVLLTFLPLLGLIVACWLFFSKGTKGANKFGADPNALKNKNIKNDTQLIQNTNDTERGWQS